MKINLRVHRRKILRKRIVNIAKAAKVSPALICGLECRKVIPAEWHWYAIAKAYKLSLAEFEMAIK